MKSGRHFHFPKSLLQIPSHPESLLLWELVQPDGSVI